MLIFSIKSKTCHTNKQTFKTILFCSCLFSGRITTAINTANDYTDDVLQNGFGTNPVWLIREKVMSASRNNLLAMEVSCILNSHLKMHLDLVPPLGEAVRWIQAP